MSAQSALAWYVNNYRKAVGVRPATTSYALQVAAWNHAKDMARMNRMTHTGSNGSKRRSAHHGCWLPVVGVGREHSCWADQLDCGVQRLAVLSRTSRQHAQSSVHPPRRRPRLRQRALLVVPRARPRLAHRLGHQLGDLGSHPFGRGRIVEDEVMPQEGLGTAADVHGRSRRLQQRTQQLGGKASLVSPASRNLPAQLTNVVEPDVSGSPVALLPRR